MLLGMAALLLSGLSLQLSAGGQSKSVRIEYAAMRTLAPVNWYTGTIISRDHARLSAEVSGRLLWVSEVGADPQQGNEVARIDDTLLKVELQERKADIQRIQARLEFFSKEYSRLQLLAKQNNAAQSQLEKTLSEKTSARSELVAAQARAAHTEAQLRRTRILAPFAGVVTERLLRAGEWADDGSAVVAMTDPDNLEVRAWVSVSALSFLARHTQLQLEVDKRILQGKVRTLVPVGDLRSRLYELRVELPRGEWNAGQSVRIAVPTATARKVLAVPRDSLVVRRDSIVIFRVGKDDIAERVSVTTGMASGRYIEVHGQLQPDDRVVVRGGERLRDGQPVRVQSMEPLP